MNEEQEKKAQVALKKTYTELIKGLQLRAIRLRAGKAQFKAKYPSPPGNDLLLPLVENAEYKTTSFGFTVLHTYTLTIKKEEKAYAVVQCSFMVDYESQAEMTEELFGIFKRVNLPLNTWPYFREYVQSSTTRMGLPTLTLPVFQVFDD